MDFDSVVSMNIVYKTSISVDNEKFGSILAGIKLLSGDKQILLIMLGVLVFHVSSNCSLGKLNNFTLIMKFGSFEELNAKVSGKLT